MEGHTTPIETVLQLDNGHLLSWSRDSTLRLWSATGEPLKVILQSSAVRKLTNGRFLTWVDNMETTLRLWLDNEEMPVSLEGHTE